MNTRNTGSLIAMLFSGSLVCGPAVADDIGSGRGNSGPDATPHETTAESCTSALDCAWQQLLDIFEMENE